ncbi:hypothetical protein [Alkalibacillus almallahensis]|uniref:hypothetical protein n=1 Tax=Alkalibacillus almallahensis TaxID=1379154 RepID=UPI00141EC22E|nr:hypothetical protein [Alkalibacillus almallahensis]NIK11639.1 hypothetical protein [Alkalibacillus almallahensis]
MTKVIALFIAASVGIFLRWQFTGEFDMNQLLIALLLLIAAPVIYRFSRRLNTRDEQYEPEHSHKPWATSISEKWLTGKKYIFHYGRREASYHRVYQRQWHKLVADLMPTPGLWFLNLRFRFTDPAAVYHVSTAKSDWKNDAYQITKDDESVARISTDVNLKTASRFLEVMHLEMGGRKFTFQAKSIRAHIEVYEGNTLIGEISKGKYGEKLFHPKINLGDEIERALIMTWIVFTYRFDKYN